VSFLGRHTMLFGWPIDARLWKLLQFHGKMAPSFYIVWLLGSVVTGESLMKGLEFRGEPDEIPIQEWGQKG